MFSSLRVSNLAIKSFQRSKTVTPFKFNSILSNNNSVIINSSKFKLNKRAHFSTSSKNENNIPNSPANLAETGQARTGPIQHPVSNESKDHLYKPSRDQGDDYLLPHPIWAGEYLNKVSATFRPTHTTTDILAKKTIDTIRFNFDFVSGYMWGKLTPRKSLIRIVFLESIAAIPGVISGVLRHLSSLRNMKRDHGWIHTLFEEAENERMHLLIATKILKPSIPMRIAVFISQGVFFNFFWVAYLVSPTFCHRLVGYLEEQAVVTYQHMLDGMEPGKSLHAWGQEKAPALAITYWKMNEDATVKDMILRYRADEAHHRDVNHTFADIPKNQPNPYKPGH